MRSLAFLAYLPWLAQATHAVMASSPGSGADCDNTSVSYPASKHDGRRCLRWVLKKVPSPCAVLADPAKLSRRRSRLGLRMRLGASRTCRCPTPSGHLPGSQARGRDALRTLFRAAPALGMAVVRRDHLLFAPQVHNQGLATSVSIMMKPMGQNWSELPSQVAGGYTSGRRAGGGAGAQAHFPGDPEGEEAGRVAAIHC